MNAMNTTKPPQPGGILIEGLRKVYGSGDTAVEALKHVNMVVQPGRGGGPGGPFGFGQEHAAQMPGRHHRAHQRQDDAGQRA